MPPIPAAFWDMQLLALLSALALLVCNAAAGLASRLAGGLALTTTAVLSAVAQVASLDGLDMFHGFTFHFEIYAISLAQPIFYVNHIFHTFQTVSHILGCETSFLSIHNEKKFSFFNGYYRCMSR